jgi:hypothetical protein
MGKMFGVRLHGVVGTHTQRVCEHKTTYGGGCRRKCAHQVSAQAVADAAAVERVACGASVLTEVVHAEGRSCSRRSLTRLSGAQRKSKVVSFVNLR